MVRFAVVLGLLALAACGGGPVASPDASGDAGPDAALADAAVDAGSDAGSDGGVDASVDGGADASVDGGSDASVDASVDGGADASVDSGADASVDGGADASVDGGADASVGDAGTYRTSLAVCWTDATCPRALAIAHGGQWDTTIPYNSNGALAAAYAGGLDGVKIDVRVTSDNVPVISHSSPIELYESVDCYNQRIENMTAAQVTQCHRVPSTTETFQRLDDVLTYLRGKMVVQLCVKRTVDYARTIQAIHAANAEDFAFIELGSPADLQTLIPSISGSSTIWYMVNIASNLPDVDTLLALNNPRAFLYELDSTVNVSSLVARIHDGGVRTFTYDSSQLASTAQLKAYFDQGYDVVSANAAANAKAARVQVNQARGLSPP